MSDAKTDRADYLFKVSEFADGTPWISWEPRRGNLPLLENSVMGFGLTPGTTLREAEEFARYLNSRIQFVSCTALERFQRR